MILIFSPYVAYNRISNCVGYRNYRYFYGFLFWATAGTLYVSVLSGYKTVSTGLLGTSTGSGNKPSVVHRLFGSKENNIYVTLYDALAGTHVLRNAAKVKKHNKSLRTVNKFESLGAEKGEDGNVPRRLDDLSTMHPMHLSAEYIVLGESNDAPRRLVGSGAAAGVTGAVEGPMGAFRVMRAGGALDWLASEDMLLFMAFMMATGVCIGTSCMLMLHTFLSKWLLRILVRTL